MTTTFRISKQRVWMPQSWSFEHAIEIILAELVNNQDVEELTKILEECVDASWKACDLTRLSVDQYNPLVLAANRASKNTFSKDIFIDEKTDYIFNQSFSELKAIIRTDPRNTIEKLEERNLLFGNKDLVFKRWVFDFILEQQAFYLRYQKHPQLLDVLVKEIYNSNKDFNLASLMSKEPIIITNSIQPFIERYIEGTSNRSYAPEVLSELSSVAKILAQNL